MDVLIQSTNDVEHAMEIVVPAEDLVPHFEKAYREEGKKLTIPGFRPGRVPLAIVKKRFGDMIEYQAIEKLSNEFFQQALEERNLRPIGAPVLENIDFEPGKPLTIKIRYETAPEIVVTGYKDLQLERFVHEVADDEVEDEITALRKARRTLVEAEKADEEGYLVTCDVTILDAEGAPLPDRNYPDLKIDLGEDGVNRDLKAELLNMSAGEEKEADLTFDSTDGEKSERARINVKKIERIILPELDDAFASLVTGGRITTFDALRADVRTYLEKSWKERYEGMLRDDLVKQLVNNNPFNVPRSVVNELLDGFVKEVEGRYPDKKLPASFKVDEFRSAREDEARFLAKWIFIRDAIIEAEGLTVGEEDIEKKADEDSVRLGIAKEHLLSFYRQPERSATLLYEKVMDYLLAASVIKDVDDEDVRGTALDGLHMHDHDHDHHDHDHHDHDHHDHDHHDHDHHDHDHHDHDHDHHDHSHHDHDHDHDHEDDEHKDTKG
ncbi:MAG: trigger factor [Ignavibacteriae bacterium]|nr:trigger factor [Ignavibacteriota bacterium]